jgi:hypothetical protein
MTKRPKLTDEAYVGEGTVKETKQFQGIRPGREVPEYRKVIDGLPDAKPAPKAASAPKKQSAKSKAGTKPAETKPAETPNETPAAPAAAKTPKTSKKTSAPESTKPVTEAKPAETPAAPAPKTPAVKKPSTKKEKATPEETPAETPAVAKPSKSGKKQKPPTAAETANKVFQKRPPKSERAKARAAKREAKGPGPIKRFGQTKPMRIAKTGAATVAAVSGVGALAVGGTRKPVSTTKAKGIYQAGANDGRLSKLTIRKAQAERAAAAAEQPRNRFGAAGESKFLKGRSAVRQSVIDQINKQGMTKSLAAVKSRRNDPEYLEAIRRYYGAKRLKQALEG